MRPGAVGLALSPATSPGAQSRHLPPGSDGRAGLTVPLPRGVKAHIGRASEFQGPVWPGFPFLEFLSWDFFTGLGLCRPGTTSENQTLATREVSGEFLRC